MTQTVIGIFKTSTEAQTAVNQLLANGLTKENVDMTSGSATATDEVGSKEHESGISKFFKELFGNDNDESDRYTNVGKRGSIVTVHVGSTEEANTVSGLLDQYGAVDVDNEQQNYTNDLFGKNATESGNNSIPIIEENLQVGKREVETGGVRLRSRIIEKPVEESLRLREEHVTVDRKAVDRVASESDLANFQESTIELSEYAEVPVVNKEARIIEEVSLNKDVQHRDEIISDTVRKTEVDVEKIESDLNNRNKI